MAHELEMKNGNASMFYVGEVPWHKLGVKLENPPTSAEAIKSAGMDWTVSLHPMNAILPDGTSLKATNRMVVRDSDSKYLSEVGPKWHPLQNHEAFSWFDPFIESGEVTLESAGSLFGGERIWVLAKLSRDPMVIVPGDEVRKYILLANSHNDKQAASVSLSAERTICYNTLCASLRRSSTRTLRARHNTRVKKNMEDIREIINTVNGEFEATAEQYRELARHQINSKDLAKYVKTVFKQADTPEVPEEFRPADDYVDNDQRKIENKIIPLFETAPGQNLPGVKGSWFSAYNAITYFLTHMRGRTVDARLDSLWFGDSERINKRALEEALKMSA